MLITILNVSIHTFINQTRIAKAKNLGIKSYEYLQKHWSEEDLDFLISNYKNMTDEEIAHILNRSIDSIRGKRDCLKLLRPVEKGVYDYLSEYIRKRNKQWKKIQLKNVDINV